MITGSRVGRERKLQERGCETGWRKREVEEVGTERRQSAVWGKLKTDKPAMSRRAAFIYVTMSGARRRRRRQTAGFALPRRSLIGELFTRGVLRFLSLCRVGFCVYRRTLVGGCLQENIPTMRNTTSSLINGRNERNCICIYIYICILEECRSEETRSIISI